MRKKTIEIQMNEKQREEFQPEQGIDISWHDDGTCTIIDYEGINDNKLNRVRGKLGNGKIKPTKDVGTNLG